MPAKIQFTGQLNVTGAGDLESSLGRVVATPEAIRVYLRSEKVMQIISGFAAAVPLRTAALAWNRCSTQAVQIYLGDRMVAALDPSRATSLAARISGIPGLQLNLGELIKQSGRFLFKKPSKP